MDKQTAHLSRRDPVLRAVIKKYPMKAHAWRPGDHFQALVVAVVNQQLSGKAADTIFKRFVALFPGARYDEKSGNVKNFPSPKRVLNVPAGKMRKVGLSRMKVAFIKDLARKILDGTVDFKKMPKWTDAEVIEHLTSVKGIGQWTAEMFLMFSLRREDVFSYGDLGLRSAMQKLYKLRAHPTPKQAEKISEVWRPYRTLASRYLWRSLDNR